MADPNRRRPPNYGGDDDGDKRDWLKTLGWAAVGLGAVWGASKIFANKDPPMRLFWDIENARCNIPYRVRFEQCVAYLRHVARTEGLGAETEYRIEVVCGGNTGKCSEKSCFHGSKLCSPEVRGKWTAGQSMLTTVNGVLLHCGWTGSNAQNRADDIIIQEMKKAFEAATRGTTLMIVTTDVSLGKRARSVAERPNEQKVICHPLDPQGSVWPSDFILSVR